MKFGRYEVLDELGRGGMGAVFRARGPDAQEVALKVLTEGRDADASQRRRFQREARALRQVHHPNVVQLLDLGEVDGAPYLAMELHTEGTLEAALARGPLAPAAVASIGAQLAAGLAAAHRAGVLHRDLKPENVLLGAGGCALLTDFGLAKELAREGQTERLTQSGSFLGTPGYWAPEQAAGQLEAIGPATDVYGLGALLYAALADRPPIVGDGLLVILDKTLHEPPPPLGSLRPDCPPALAAIIHRCLEKDPAAHWESAQALGEALDTWEQLPVPAARAKGPLPLLLAGVGLAAVSGLVGWRLGVAQAPPPLEATSPTTPTTPPTAPTATPPSAAQLLQEAERAAAAQHPAEAAALLERAAAQGSARAMARLAEALLAGEGVPADERAAARWYRRAAEAGEVDAMHALGVLLDGGRGVARDERAAAAWYRKAATAGDRRAQHNLALMLMEGRGGPADPRQAVRWYREAARQGLLPSMHNLARALFDGRGVPRDRRAGVAQFRRAAERGYGPSMVELAACLARGEGVPAPDLVEALRWSRVAAEKGLPTAMHNLGVHYEDGLGVDPDPAEAERWYRRAAAKGNARSLLNLSKLLLERGTPRARADARALLQRATRARDPAIRRKAQRTLAQLGR